MPSLKDWKPGTFRIKLNIITDKGTRLDYHIPYLNIAAGEVFIAAASAAATEKNLSVTAMFKKIRKFIRDVKLMKGVIGE